MLQKVLKFANYSVAVLVKKIMLFCSSYAKNYASTIRQGVGIPPRGGGQSLPPYMVIHFVIVFTSVRKIYILQILLSKSPKSETLKRNRISLSA